MKKLALAIIFAAISSPAIAEPSPSVSTLMNTPTSAFSFGLYRLDLKVKDASTNASQLWRWSKGSIVSGADYDWDANRVTAYLYTWEEFETKSEFEAACTDVFSAMRLNAGVQAGTDRLWGERNVSHWARLFGPTGYINDNAEKNMVEIDKLFTIQFEANVAGKMSGKCSAPLISKEMSVSFSSRDD